MEIKNYMLEYLINGFPGENYIDDECDADFEASGENNLQDWLKASVKDMQVIDQINYKHNDDDFDSYNVIIKVNDLYYSVYVEYSREYGVDEVYYDSLQQVIPKQKTITVYEPVDK